MGRTSFVNRSNTEITTPEQTIILTNEAAEPVTKLSIDWITNDSQFATAIERWQKSDFLAVDTEFERRTTYFPKFALLQIYDGQRISIVDPLSVSVIDSFRELMSNPALPKIMHSAKEDLEVFLDSGRCKIEGLFDTQIAYSFVSGETSIGYANLVDKVCQKRVSKSATQSDWMQRPLSNEQIQYAAEDVLYLPELFNYLSNKLETHLSLAYFKRECDEMSEAVAQQPDFEVDYRHAKEVFRLDQDHLSLFKSLYQWREETAIEQNRTRNHIAKDAVLVKIAQSKPRSMSYLRNLDGVHPSTVRRYGQQILALVEEWQTKAEAPINPIKNPRDVSGLKGLNELFLSMAGQIAKDTQIAIAILASKRFIRKVAYAYMTNESFPELWSGWRGELLKPHFDRIYSQFNPSNSS